MTTLTILPRAQTIGRAAPTMRVIRIANDVRERSRAVPRAVRCDHCSRRICVVHGSRPEAK